jgi:hypothetical protein
VLEFVWGFHFESKQVLSDHFWLPRNACGWLFKGEKIEDLNILIIFLIKNFLYIETHPHVYWCWIMSYLDKNSVKELAGSLNVPYSTFIHRYSFMIAIHKI